MLILTSRKQEYYDRILSETPREDWKAWLQEEFHPKHWSEDLDDEQRQVLNDWYMCVTTELTDDVPDETIIDIVNIVLATRSSTMLDMDYPNYERPLIYKSDSFSLN